MSRPTIIDEVEVFDSSGTLALIINGLDTLYLKVVNDKFLSQESHQEIIDVICNALGFPQNEKSSQDT